MLTLAPSRSAWAQDDVCTSGQMAVSPCTQAETHVSAGGVAVFSVANYGYADDAYLAGARCTGIVTNCRGGGNYYVAAYGSVDINVSFSISQQSGTGTAGAAITSTWLGGDVYAYETVYGQTLLAVDSAQTPTSGVDQTMGRCALDCFTATAAVSTVPFVTLGRARSVTLLYNEERAHPKPFIYATVSPAADGPTVARYQFSATLNGGPVTFTNGEQTLSFISSWNEPVRLGGQVALQTGGPAMYTLVVTVTVQYQGGSTATRSYESILAVNDASNSRYARGWTIAEEQKLDCAWTQGCMVAEGDGSVMVFLYSSISNGRYYGTDHSALWWDGSLWNRQYMGGSVVQFDGNGFMTAFTDSYGRTTTYVRDGSYRLVAIRDPRRNAGASVPYYQLEYGQYGLSAIREVGGTGPGRVTTVAVDAGRNLTAITDPDGVSRMRAYYLGNGYLSATVDRLGGATNFNPTWFGKVGAISAPAIPVDAGGGTTTTGTSTTYFTPWQEIGVPSGPTASAPPVAAAMRDIWAAVQAPGNRTTQFSVNAWGQPGTTIDPFGQQTVVTYAGRNAVSVRYPDWSVDVAQYDALDRPNMVKAAGDSATYYYYNAQSRLDSVRGKGVVATNFRYNPDNTLASTSDASGTGMTFSYNASKQVATANDNVGHQTGFGYDPTFSNPNSVVLPGPRTTTTLLDAYGRDSVVTAPLLAPVTTVYDAVNRPVQLIQAGRPATVLGYDDAARVSTVRDANGNLTQTSVNALGWPISRTDPQGAQESFRYDIAGRRTSWTNRRGDLMTYTYDERDRLTSRSGRGVADNYSYSPDGNISVAWNSAERDSMFHVPAVGSNLGADSTVTWVNGVRYRVMRGHMGALDQSDSMAISATSGVGFRNRYTYYPSSGLRAAGLPNQIRNGFTTTYVEYNDENLPITVSRSPGGGARYPNYTTLHAPSWVSYSTPLNSAFGRSYGYDALGRLSAVGAPYAGTQRRFRFDQYGELAGVDSESGCAESAPFDASSGYVLGCASGAGSVSYSYDAVGNRTDLGASYYVGNRLALFNGGWHTYDADGNLSQKYGVGSNPHNQLFYWNAESRLDSVSYDGYITVRYEYNALGQPVRKYRNGVLDRVWLWDGASWLAEFDAANRRVSEYQYGGTDSPTGSVIGYYAPSSIRYPEQDALGNVMGTYEGTSSGLSVTQSVSYDAWGVPSYSGAMESRLMWKGLMWEGDAVGLYYVRNRWYDPEVGRFIQEDPIGLAGGINPYTFAGNDPVNGADPTGLSGDCPTCEQLSLVWIREKADSPINWGLFWATLIEGISDGGGGGLWEGLGGGGGGGGGQQQPSQQGCPNVSSFERQLANLADRRSTRSGVEEGVAVVWRFIPVPVFAVRTPSTISPRLPWGTTAFIHNHPSGRGISENDSMFAYSNEVRVVSGSGRTKVYGSINPGGSRVTCRF